MDPTVLEGIEIATDIGIHPHHANCGLHVSYKMFIRRPAYEHAHDTHITEATLKKLSIAAIAAAFGV